MSTTSKSMPQAARERSARRLQTRNTARVHHVDTRRVPSCPPCHGNCEQGDTCPAPRRATRRVTEADLDRAQAERDRMWRHSQRRDYPTDARVRGDTWRAIVLLASAAVIAWVALS